MAASTRTPSAKQVQVMFAIVHEGRHTTAQIHEFRAKGLAGSGKPAEKQRASYEVLNACDRYEWIERAVANEDERKASPNDGAGIEWHITTDGRKALERGMAALQRQKEAEVGTTTDAPPESKPAWGAGQEPTEPATPPAPEDPDLKELDEPGEGDDSQEEAVDPSEVEVEDAGVEKQEKHVVEGSNQLTMLVVPKGSRLKPKQFTLAVRGRQQEFGTTREYLGGQRVAFTGVLEVDEVRTKRKKDGTWVKVAMAKIAEIDLLDQPADDE